MSIPPKPNTLPVRPEQIPVELKEAARWVLWKWDWRDGKWTKPPLTLLGEPASVTDPATWTTFDQAVAVHRLLGADGIGRVLVAGDGLVGVDLDGCVLTSDDGTMEPWARDIVIRLTSYTERSPSGRGLRIWCRGTLPAGGRRKGHLEMYREARYLTATGQRLPDLPASIEDRTAELAALHAEIFAPKPHPRRNGRPGDVVDLDDAALLERARHARNGGKFSALWHGETSGFPSPSEADLALCGLLAFWCGRDASRVDALFRRSGLMREKWDARHFSDGRTYGEATLAQAIAECATVYTPRTRTAPPVRSEPDRARQDVDVDDPLAEADGPDPDTFVASGAIELAPEAPAHAPTVHHILPPGFISRYVAVALRSTDAPAEAHALIAVLVLSALAGPRPRLPLAFRRDAGQRLVLWGMNIVDSTEGRKTTVNQLGVDVLSRVLGDSAILPWKGSPEAFIQLMAARDGQTCVFPRDEYTGLLVGIKHGGYLAGLAQDFIRAYDGLPIAMARTAKMNRTTGVRTDDTDRVRDPYLVKICAATRSRFIEVATIDDVLDGLLARFIFTSGSAPEQPMKRRTTELDTAWTEVVTLAQTFHDQAQDVLTIEISDTIMARHFDLEQRFKAAALRAARPEAGKPAMKRLAVSVLQIAALLALERATDGRAVLTDTDLEAATALSPPWRATTLGLIADIGRTQHQARCDAVLATVRTRPDGVARRLLFRLHRGLKGREFEEVVGDLEQQGLIHQAKTAGQAGRAAIVYRPGPRS